jgi:hypothetical protein
VRCVTRKGRFGPPLSQVSKSIFPHLLIPLPARTLEGKQNLFQRLLINATTFPLHYRKRVSAKESPYHLPSSLLAIWTPLLGSVVANHAHFPAVLTSHIIAHLLDNDNDNPTVDGHTPSGDATAATAAEKASYDVCLATWAAWLIEWRRSTDETDADVTVRRQDAFFQLAQALVVTAPPRSSSSSSSQTGCVLPVTERPSRQIDSHPQPKITTIYFCCGPGRGRFSLRCVPRIGSSLEFQTRSWVSGRMFPRWVIFLEFKKSRELTFGWGEGGGACLVRDRPRRDGGAG